MIEEKHILTLQETSNQRMVRKKLIRYLLHQPVFYLCDSDTGNVLWFEKETKIVLPIFSSEEEALVGQRLFPLITTFVINKNLFRALAKQYADADIVLNPETPLMLYFAKGELPLNQNLSSLTSEKTQHRVKMATDFYLVDLLVFPEDFQIALKHYLASLPQIEKAYVCCTEGMPDKNYQEACLILLVATGEKEVIYHPLLSFLTANDELAEDWEVLFSDHSFARKIGQTFPVFYEKNTSSSN